jgi:putative ABC transport system permease protein
VGQSLSADRDPDDEPGQRELRVVGVMRAFRQDGALDAREEYALLRAEYARTAMQRLSSLALRMRPGTDAAVEARLAAALQAAAPDWSFKLEPMEVSAESSWRLALAPILLALVVATFLILMVALGLSGVLWQSVTTRVRELGVRRALGASAQDIRRQVIGELLVMATLAMAGGLVVVLQFPFLDLLGPVPSGVFFGGLALTIGALYALALVCAWQPARLATRVHPAEALRYE